MFGVTINRPTNMYCDNKAFYSNATIQESVLSKKHHSCAYHVFQEALASGMVRIAKEDILKFMDGLFTNTIPRVVRDRLLDMIL